MVFGLGLASGWHSGIPRGSCSERVWTMVFVSVRFGVSVTLSQIIRGSGPGSEFRCKPVTLLVAIGVFVKLCATSDLVLSLVRWFGEKEGGK